jgi:hypothetical protein
VEHVSGFAAAGFSAVLKEKLARSEREMSDEWQGLMMKCTQAGRDRWQLQGTPSLLKGGAVPR